MQAGKAAELRKAWGNKPCSHPTLEAEYYHGGDTGAYVCTACGKTFNADEEENLRRFRSALEGLIGDRGVSLHVTGENLPNPHLEIDPIIQVQLLLVSAEMGAIGTTPDAYPVTEFDQAIKFRRLTDQSIDWLQKSGVPARRHFAPLAADYRRLFSDLGRLPTPRENVGRFFSLLLHWLQVESQIIIAKQYYHRLGLYIQDPFREMPLDGLPSEIAHLFRQGSLNSVDIPQLHGRIFLEYCAIMIRAQWDKLALLCYWAFGLKEKEDSITQKLKVLADALLDGNKGYHPWCQHHLKVFLKIAQQRLDDNGWLRRFRDSLVHSVGEHSAGVVPRKKNEETTSELWDKVRDEHDWLREAMMAALIAIVNARAPSEHANKICQQADQ